MNPIAIYLENKLLLVLITMLNIFCVSISSLVSFPTIYEFKPQNWISTMLIIMDLLLVPILAVTVCKNNEKLLTFINNSDQ